MTKDTAQPPEYCYYNGEAAHTNAYLLPTVDALLARYVTSGARVFDLGCGNGSVARHLIAQYNVTGVDASWSGIAQANSGNYVPE